MAGLSVLHLLTHDAVTIIDSFCHRVALWRNQSESSTESLPPASSAAEIQWQQPANFTEWEIRNFVSFSLFLAASRAEGGGKINETTNIEFIRTFLQLWGRPFYWEWPAGEIWVVMFRHYSRFEREMEEEERRELIIWRPASCIRRRSMSALVSVIRLGRANQKPGQFSFFLALLSLIWLLFPFMHFPLVLIAFFFLFYVVAVVYVGCGWTRNSSPRCVCLCVCVCV